jgi:hypothetical protein
LLANRAPDNRLVCFVLGRSGGGCEEIGRAEGIQIVGLVRHPPRQLWWGIARDDVRKVRTGGREFTVSHGFGVPAETGATLTAFDAEGNSLGEAEATAPPIICDPSACSVTMTFAG